MKKLLLSLLLALSLVNTGVCQVTKTLVSYTGTYGSTATYAKSDLVVYAGSTFISLLPNNKGNEPDTSPAYWAAFIGPVGPQGPLGPVGPQGLPGVSSLSELSLVRVTAQQPTNLFDASQVTMTCFIDATTGIAHIGSPVPASVGCSELIPANSGANMVTNLPIGDYGNVAGLGFNGVAFYASDGVTFISGIQAPSPEITPGTPLAVPANAAFMRYSAIMDGTTGFVPSQVMLVNGSTVPSSYVGFGFVTPFALSNYVPTGQITPSQIALLRATPTPLKNLIDITALLPQCFVRYDNGAVECSGTLPGVLVATPLIPANAGSTMTLNFALANDGDIGGLGFQGIAFYGADGVTYLSGIEANATGATAPNTPITIPANAYYMRFGIDTQVFGDGLGPATISLAMLVNGSTMPSSYVSYGYLTASQITSTLPANANGTPIPASELMQVPNTNLQWWFSALHDCQNEVVRIGVFQDSRGIVDTTVTPGPNPTLSVTFPFRWTERLRKKIQASGCGSHGTGVVPFRYGYGGANSFQGQGFNADFFTGTATNFVATDTTLGPFQNGDPMAITATVNGAVINFITSIPFDHLSMLCTSGTGINPWTLAIDGTNVGTCGVASGSETATRAVSSAVTLGTHTASVTCLAQPCTGYAVEGIAGTTGVSVDNYSVGGASLEIQAAQASQWAFADLNPPQLAIMGHGTNEPGLSIPPSTFQTSLTNFINHVRGYSTPASVLFYIPMQDNDNPSAALNTYYPLVMSTAAANKTGFVDLRDRWGTSPAPSQFFGSDYIHENNIGNGEAFSAIWQTVIDVLP